MRVRHCFGRAAHRAPGYEDAWSRNTDHDTGDLLIEKPKQKSPVVTKKGDKEADFNEQPSLEVKQLEAPEANVSEKAAAKAIHSQEGTLL